jgi:hypothetical protein
LPPAQGFHTGDQFAQYLIDAFDVLYAEGAAAPKMLSIGLHCPFDRAASAVCRIGQIS